MALFRTVSPQEATGKVKEVYEDIKETKGIDFIPNFWQALSNNPDHKEPDLLRRLRVQSFILVPGLHWGCVFTRKTSALSGLIQNLEPNWLLQINYSTRTSSL
jgi:hypothetical protein